MVHVLGQVKFLQRRETDRQRKFKKFKIKPICASSLNLQPSRKEQEEEDGKKQQLPSHPSFSITYSIYITPNNLPMSSNSIHPFVKQLFQRTRITVFLISRRLHFQHFSTIFVLAISTRALSFYNDRFSKFQKSEEN